MYRPRLVISAVLVLLAPLALSETESEFIKVRAEATVAGEGVAARGEAVTQAERDILRLCAQSVVPESSVPSFEDLFANTEAYIRSTQLVRYETMGGETRVEIESYVNRRALLESIAKTAVKQLATPPTVLCLIAERIGEANEFRVAEPGVAEEAIAKALEEKGLRPVGYEAVNRCFSAQELSEAIQAGPDSLGDLARRSFADVLIAGVATSTPANEPGGGNVRANQAAMDLHVFRASDGALVEALSSKAVVHSVDDAEGGRAAIEDACAKAVSELVTSAILAGLAIGQRHEVLLTVDAPGARGRFDEILAALKEFCGVDAVQELFYTDTLARVRVEYDGLMGPFMDNLTLRAYADFSVEVERAIQRDVTVVIEALS